MKLIHKLIAGFLVIALLIWVVGFFAVEASKSSLKDYFIGISHSMANELLREIDEYVHGKIEVFQAYSTDETLSNAVNESNIKFEKMDDLQKYITEVDQKWKAVSESEFQSYLSKELSTELTEKIEFYKEKYGYEIYSEVFVTNRYGAVIAATNKTTDFRQDDEEWWLRARDNGINIADIERDNSSRSYAIDIAIRVEDNGEFIGVMKVMLNIQEISNMLYEFEENDFHVGHNSMVFRLTTKEGKLIYSSDVADQFLSDVPDALLKKGHLSPYTENSQVSSFMITDKTSGRERFLVHAHSDGFKDYKGLGWVILMEHDANQVFAPAIELRNLILAICLAVTMIALLMGFYISSRISKSVGKLRDAVISIGNGDLNTRIDVRSNDEIGQLGREFQKMADNLKFTTVRLDMFAKEVDERKQTEELLLQSKQDWVDTFDTITDIITVHDDKYNIIRANKAAEKILNIPDNILGKSTKCFQHYHGTETPPEGCPSCSCLTTEESTIFEVFEPHLNAYVEIRSIPRFDSNKKLIGLIHVARDISKRKEDEDLIKTQLNRLNALRSIDRAIIGSIDLRIILDIFLEQVKSQMNIDAASVLLLNKHTQLLEYVVNSGFNSGALKYTKLKLGESNAGRAALERRIVSIPDLREENGAFADSEQFSDEKFVAYFAVPLVAKGQVKGILEIFHRSPINATPDWLEFLEAIADQGAIAVDNATLFDELQRSNIELTLAYDNTIEGWSHAMDLRDRETEGHSQRVTEMTLDIAREMGIKEKNMMHIKRGALLHDIGKIGVPDNILLKPGPLTAEEWVVMKRHPEYARDMLYPIEYLRPAMDIPYYHHEKWDGTGYPRGLKGVDIPITARIFAVVDVWDALTSDRPYRRAWTKEKTVHFITSKSGTHFDPAVVDTFLKLVSEDSTVLHSPG